MSIPSSKVSTWISARLKEGPGTRCNRPSVPLLGGMSFWWREQSRAIAY
jgi:hypothetical protein